jgi:16S rRNA (uracil1498-N3)-methyltransferase
VTDSAGTVPRFFVDRSPSGGVGLCASDAEHAVRVLRLSAGDRCIGLDGRGGIYPLRIASARRGGPSVEPDGEPRFEPPPGAPGSPVPRVELALSLPRGARAEAMLDRLVQLGASSIVPLVTERTPPRERERGLGRTDRLLRIAREACKQCGRAWLPVIEAPATIAALAQRPGLACVASPGADASLLDWLARVPSDAGSIERPVLLVVGPEGGFTAGERDALGRAGAAEVRLGPLVLRVETAAETAVAASVLALSRGREPGVHHAMRSRSDT